MGLFQKIIEGFKPSLSAEEEKVIQKNIADFNLAVLQLTNHYIPLGEIAAFKGNWHPVYTKIKG